MFLIWNNLYHHTSSSVAVYFLQSRMAASSARHAKPSTGRKQAPSLLGRWSTTSSPTASLATQTVRASASSTTFLLGSRSEPSHFTKPTELLLWADPLSLKWDETRFRSRKGKRIALVINVARGSKILSELLLLLQLQWCTSGHVTSSVPALFWHYRKAVDLCYIRHAKVIF